MKILYYAFFCFTSLFVAVELFRWLDADFPDWVFYYLSDFLCMPVVLTICLVAVHWLKGDSSLKLGLVPIVSLTVLYSVYFELILPRISERYTADLLDVVMYFAGSLVYYLLQEASFRNYQEKDRAA